MNNGDAVIELSRCHTGGKGPNYSTLSTTRRHQKHYPYLGNAKKNEDVYEVHYLGRALQKLGKTIDGKNTEEETDESRQAQSNGTARPRCVFAPEGSGPRTLYGRTPSGDLLHVSDVPSGAGDLVCPDCGIALVAHKGAKIAHHFKHESAEECRHAGETALHLLAKEIISEQGSLSLPGIKIHDTAIKR